MNILATSDIEGYSLNSIIDLNKENIVCGDILDSTLSGMVPLAKFLNAKSHNLRNIQTILQNPGKVILVLGNRDINKIKCKFLCTLKMNDNEYTTMFNNGGIDLNIETYQKLKEGFNGGNPWNIENLNAWYPYWNGALLNRLDKQGKITPIYAKDWTQPEGTDKPFLNRFNNIFGVDGPVGTMSAGNLLHTIPNEIGITTTDDDYKAFITLAVFKSLMCDNPNVSPSGTVVGMTNTNVVKGWLVKLYGDSDCITYREMGTNKYLFSHGGLTSTLLADPNVLTNVRNGFEDEQFALLLTDFGEFKKIRDEKIGLPQVGGFYKQIAENASKDSSSVKTAVDTINSIVKKSINAILSTPETTTVPDADGLFIMAYSSPFTCKVLENVGSTVCRQSDIMNSNKYSTIAPGYDNMRNNSFTLTDGVIHQVFGHKPMGYSTVVDLITDSNGNKCYLVNLDNSNSFAGESFNEKIYEKSVNKILINESGVQLNTNITITNNEKTKTKTGLFSFLNKKSSNSNTGFSNIQKDLFGNTNKSIDIAGLNITDFNKFNNEIPLVDKLKINNIVYSSSYIPKQTNVISISINTFINEELDNVIKSFPDMKSNIHGIVNKDGITYIVFTYDGTEMFKKSLFILTNEDLETYKGLIMKTTQKGGKRRNKKTKKVAHKHKSTMKKHNNKSHKKMKKSKKH